jgi:hypothetical protein
MAVLVNALDSGAYLILAITLCWSYALLTTPKFPDSLPWVGLRDERSAKIKARVREL